jgi:hypothetical protein
MRARVPLDVDLEDRIAYGLTPVRLAYIVLAGLAALVVWESRIGPGAVRAPIAIVALAAGAALGWGRWRGRAADRWIVDLALFTISTRRVRVMPQRPAPHEQDDDVRAP